MTMSFLDLEGQVAIVTGGARGIGGAIAGHLIEAGTKTVVFDVIDEKDVPAPLAELKYMHVDVSDGRQVDQAVAAVKDKFGRIDILVNSAGIIRRGKALEISPSQFEDCYRVNVQGSFKCAQAVGRVMAEARTGSIVNIASTNALAGVPNIVAYNSSKGAIIAMTRSLAIEWAPLGIRVNVICPNAVITDMSSDRLSLPGMAEWYVQHIPLGRILEPDDLAKPALFLASNAAAGMITGTILNVDGGYMAQ